MTTVLHSVVSGGNSLRQFFILELRVAKVDDSSAFWSSERQKLTTVLHSGASGSKSWRPFYIPELREAKVDDSYAFGALGGRSPTRPRPDFIRESCAGRGRDSCGSTQVARWVAA